MSISPQSNSPQTKRMLISVDRDESRAAVVDDGQLVHLEIEPVNRNTCKGNIYRALVARVEPSLQSAFVDFGNDKQGFLPVGEIHPKLRGGNNDRRAPIQDLLRAKTEILVQVVRDEIGQKGATLSTFISLPGRYLVLIPESDKDKAGVSRKLSDEARDRIKKLTETMKVPEGFGLIVRTAGETATELELQKDLTYLSRQWAHITEKYESAKGPTLLYAERSLPVRFVRDYFTKDIEEVVIDDDPTLHEVAEFLSVLMPRGLSAVVRYAGDVPLFARYGVEGKVEDVFARQVFLPSGGSIVIDQTEAMVSVDVNSGRVKEKDIEETARATNIEAAQEIARQMILRDMGGLIVIDFIDMRDKKYVREVEQALKDSFKNDKARTKIAHISEFGLLEMSRQRIKSSVNKGAFDSCPHCSGTGRLRAMDSVGMSVLRRIYELVAQKRVRYVIAMVPPATARYLLNARRTELAMVEKQYHLTIEIVAVDGLAATQVVMEHLEDVPEETGAARADRQKLLRVTQELDLVRNHLVKREEARMQLEVAAAKRGARVDYADIYREVRELTGTADELRERPARRPERAEAAAEVAVPVKAAPVQAAAMVAPDLWPEPPRSKGIGGWLKSLFGLSEPEPVAAPLVSAPVTLPLAALPPARTSMAQAGLAPTAAGAPSQRGGETGDRHERSDRERRPRDRGDRPDRGDRSRRDEPRAAEKAVEGGRAAAPERAERTPDRPDRADRGERPDRGERRERVGEAAQAGERGDRPERGTERRDRPGDAAASPDRAERPERGERPDRGAERGSRRDRPGDGAAAQLPFDIPGVPVTGQTAAVAAEGAAAETPEEMERRGRRRRRRRGGRSDQDGTQGDDNGALAAEDRAGGDETSDGDSSEAAIDAQAGMAHDVDGATADSEARSAAAGEETDAADAQVATADAAHAETGSSAEAPGSEAESATAEADAGEDGGPSRGRGRRRSRRPSERDPVATPAGEGPETRGEVAAEADVATDALVAAAVVAEDAVDARSLVHAEMERLRSAQAQAEPAPATEATPEAAAAVDAPAGKASATKRFVVDLRTGSR